MYIYMLQDLYKCFWKTKKSNSCKMIFSIHFAELDFEVMFFHETPCVDPNFHCSPKMAQKNPVFICFWTYNITGQHFNKNAYTILVSFIFTFYCWGNYILYMMVGTILMLIQNKYKVKSGGGRGGRNSFKYVKF